MLSSSIILDITKTKSIWVYKGLHSSAEDMQVTQYWRDVLQYSSALNCGTAVHDGYSVECVNTGPVFVLYHQSWSDFSIEFGFYSKSTIWRQLRRTDRQIEVFRKRNCQLSQSSAMHSNFPQGTLWNLNWADKLPFYHFLRYHPS